MSPSYPEGVRPWRTQKDYPPGKVTLWEIDTYGSLDAAGKPLPRRRHQVKGSRAKAVAQRKSLIARLAAAVGTAFPEERATKPKPAHNVPTLKEYCENDYLKLIEDKLRSSTVASRRRHLEQYVYPLLGDLPITEANTPESIRKLKAHIRSYPKIKSLAYANQILLTFSTVLSMGCDPHTHARPPLPNRVKVPAFAETDFSSGEESYYVDGFKAGHLRHKRLSDERLRALLEVCTQPYDLATIGLGLFLGCRNGEACGLRWEDLDLQRGSARIWSSVSPDGHVWVPRTKSLAGTIKVEPTLLKALRELNRTGKSEYVLGPNRDGVPYLNTRNLGDRYNLLHKKAGLGKSYNYHALRHTFCSRLADAGFSVPEIKVLARHKSIKSTYGYVQPDRSRLDQAADALTFRL